MDVTPAPIPLTEVNASSDTLILTGDFAAFSPEVMFDYWTKPELLTQWWPPQAEVEPRTGGAYHLSWPTMNWHLRGHFANFEPERSLAFTWKWDHEPDTPTREVEVTLHAHAEGGTRITIIHGTYNESERDQNDRASHIEGWQYFCGKLGELSPGVA
jgi:uncharacterized protein YndB with AHSA1/START domain